MSVPSDKACAMATSEVEEILHTNCKTGLAREEIVRRRAVHGYNEFEISEEEPLWKRYLGQVVYTRKPKSSCIREKLRFSQTVSRVIRVLVFT